MINNISRRELLRILSAAGFGTVFATRTVADEVGKKGVKSAPSGWESVRKPIPVTPRDRYPATIVGGKIIQPQRPLPVIAETDVLVVGGGCAGFAAAVSAARAGVKTTIVERYGYFGGLWSGGLVLVVISTHAREKDETIQVLRGIGGELLDRHKKVQNAITDSKYNPTTDPEATKYFMDEMITESGATVLLHSWASDVVMDGNAVCGVVFESKSGRQAILAKVIVDATGDGDIFAAAGAEFEQWLHAIGLVHRRGNVDRADMDKLKAAGIKSLGGGKEPVPSVRWINMRGPMGNALDVKELTRLEMEHRRTLWQGIQQVRKTPGGENVFLLQTAPQLGVRVSRVLAGTHKLTGDEARVGTKFPDTVGVGGAQTAKHVGWPIPYGALLPKKLDGLLAAGRCICVDEKLIEDMRLIAPCLTTGHAAGAAAAVAVQSKCRPRDVDIKKVQKLLKDQGAHLG
ncbi:MAG: FAD-dependent oxidoreductase [Verrucomicrobia bacterium]|nr:FAD-dependent oxidoreductase [Verrucomicrobiota bacterium]